MKRSRARQAELREAKAARRRERTAGRGSARRHWDRRRDGRANSAPELRGRTLHDPPEHVLLGGVQTAPVVYWNRDGNLVSVGRTCLKGLAGA